MFKDYDTIKHLLKYVVSKLNQYKLLNNVLPTISSFDERKQLILEYGYPDDNNNFSNSIIFSQNFRCISCIREGFLLEELIIISENIKKEFEDYLDCGVYNKIILENFKDTC